MRCKAVAVGGLLLLCGGAAGCTASENKVSKSAVSSLLGQSRDIHLNGNSLDDLARNAGTNTNVVRDFANAPTEDVWAGFTASLQDLNEETDGPLRELVIDSACDAAQNSST